MTHNSARTFCYVLLLALLPVAQTHADAPGDLAPVEVNQDARLPSWRLDYAHRISGKAANDDYLGLMATRDLYALFYEHARTAPFGPEGSYGLDRLAFLYGGPSRPDRGESGGYVGLGQTWLRGPQLRNETSLLLRWHLEGYRQSPEPDVGVELNLAIPLTTLSGGSQSNVTRETDGEVAVRFPINRYSNFRYAYRRIRLDRNSTGGWYISIGLVY